MLVGNQDMGFIPALDSLHHVEAFVMSVGSGLMIDITITGLGTDSLLHTYEFSFLDSSPSLGTGKIGVARQGSNTDDGFFDNLQVFGSPGSATPLVVPEPSTLPRRSPICGTHQTGWRSTSQTSITSV